VTIPFASVETITTDAQLFITLADGRTVSGQLSTTGDRAEVRTNKDVIAVERSAIRMIRTPDEQRKYEESLNPGWLQQWNGGIDFGFALTSGNSEMSNLAFGFRSESDYHDRQNEYICCINL